MTINKFCLELNNNNIGTEFIINEIRRLKLNFIWHPLGFIMGTYLNEGNEKIRIHIWPGNSENAQLPYWNIHNHSFDLTSWVLEGEIINTQYTIIENNTSNNCIYTVSYDENNSILKKTNKSVCFVSKLTESNKKGSKYSMDGKVFHSSISEKNKIALTIVLSSSSDNKIPLVIGEKNANSEYLYMRDKVDINTLNKFLNKLNNESNSFK